MNRFSRSAGAICLPLAWALVGCGDDGPTPPILTGPAYVVLDVLALEGEGQEAVAGSEVSDVIVLRAVGAILDPVPGARFLLSPTDDGTISIAGASASGEGATIETTADINGEVRMTWRLTTQAGFTTFRAAAFFPGQSDTIAVYVAATALAGPLAHIVQEGDNQAAAPGEPLALPLGVVLLDAYDNGLPDVDVGWTVLSGGGSVDAANAVSDADGRATTLWTLGASAGDQRVAATIGGGGTVIFTAVAL